MKIAIVYDSLSGNTKMLALKIQEKFQNEVVYCGAVDLAKEADIYFVGSWTDKGNCSKKISEFLNTLSHKKIAYFGTAGFGGSQAYYDNLWQRVQSKIPVSNDILGHYFCQGKMPMRVRERYVQLMTENPEDKNLVVSLQNFDEALNHPNDEDFKHLDEWLSELNIS